MVISKFPSVEHADIDGLVAIGGDMELKTLLLAYENGIFPWPGQMSKGHYLAWYSPDPRGVMDFSEVKISKRLQRYLRSLSLEISVNTRFESVMLHCAQVKRNNQSGSWIFKSLVDAYTHFHHKGFAYSIEGLIDGELVSGLYGVVVNGIVSGESMFTLGPNAGKGVFLALMELLNQAGIPWLDIQTVSPIMARLGGKAIPRRDFLQRIKQSPPLSRDQVFGSPGRKNISFL